MPRRYRVLQRSPLVRWTRRILALGGTAVVLALGGVVASMVLPGGDDGTAAAPAATPPARSTSSAKAPLTARQRAERRRAAAAVRRRGYALVSLAHYRADHVLRVLIGEPVSATVPGRRAFFFVRGRYIGHDAGTPSGKLRPGRKAEREITLVYSLYGRGDRACCPKGGDVRVRFRWTGEALEPRDAIPPAARRMPPG